MKTIDVNELATILGGNNPICDDLQDEAAKWLTQPHEEEEDDEFWDDWSKRWIEDCAGGVA